MRGIKNQKHSQEFVERFHKNLQSDVPFKELPEWFKKATTLNANVSYQDNKLVWISGTWFAGEWYGDEWKNGMWYRGVWHKGIWHNGWWRNGEWKNGEWRGGTWVYGTWKGEEKYGI